MRIRTRITPPIRSPAARLLVVLNRRLQQPDDTISLQELAFEADVADVGRELERLVSIWRWAVEKLWNSDFTHRVRLDITQLNADEQKRLTDFLQYFERESAR